MRPSLCQEAMRLGRVLAGLMPKEAEVHSLVALMEIQASRLRARTGPGGEPILLQDQNRARWDWLLIQRGLAALDTALECVNNHGGTLGPYGLQALIAACHARARKAEDTDWAQIAQLYARLTELIPSPVIELNRAVAVSMASGPQSALELVEPLATALSHYHLFHGVRGDLLSKLDRRAEAAAAFQHAAALTRNAREREVYLGRAGHQ